MDSCAGTEEDFARIYPRPSGKVWPRGYCKLVEQEAIVLFPVGITEEHGPGI